MSRKYVSCLALIGSLSLMSSSGMAGIAQEDYQKLTAHQNDMKKLIGEIEQAINQDELKAIKDIGERKYDKTDEDLGVTLLFAEGTVLAASGHPQKHPLVNLSHLKDEEGNFYVQEILELCAITGSAQRFVKNTSIKGKRTSARFYAKQMKDKGLVILVRKADSETIAPERGAHEALNTLKK